MEAFDEVERAFVHVDYCKRLEPEHKVDYNLLHHNSDLFDGQQVLESSASHSGHLSGKLSGSISGGENSGLSQENSKGHGTNAEGSQHRGENLV